MRDRDVRGEEGDASFQVLGMACVLAVVMVVAVIAGHAALTGGLGHGVITAIELVAGLAVVTIAELVVVLLLERIDRRRGEAPTPPPPAR